MQVFKLLKLAARETDNDGKPANEHVRRQALNKAAHKMAALRLKTIDESQIRSAVPPAPPPVPTYPTAAPFYHTTTSTGFVGSSYTEVRFGNVIFRVVVG